MLSLQYDLAFLIGYFSQPTKHFAGAVGSSRLPHLGSILRGSPLQCVPLSDSPVLVVSPQAWEPASISSLAAVLWCFLCFQTLWSLQSSATHPNLTLFFSLAYLNFLPGSAPSLHPSCSWVVSTSSLTPRTVKCPLNFWTCLNALMSLHRSVNQFLHP